MGNLLIRNLDDGLKSQLQDSARLNGRSLSEEAIVLLRRSLAAMTDDKGSSAGERLRAILGDVYWTEEELVWRNAATNPTGSRRGSMNDRS